MFDFLERLRNESESYRRRVTIIVALSLTGVILVAWTMSLSAGSFYAYNKEPQAVATTSPLTAVWIALTESISGIKDAIGSLKDTKIIFTATTTPEGGGYSN